MTSQTLHGTVEGDTIHLTEPSSLPSGTAVRIILFAEDSPRPVLAPGEGLKRAFGAWADYAEELDRFTEENRRLRKLDRPELAE